MENLLLGQYVPSDSFVHRMDARAKLLGFLLLLAVVLLAADGFGYIWAAAVTAAAVLAARLPAKSLVVSFRGMWPFFLVIFSMNALFSKSGEAFWSWWIFRLSAAGILQGIRVAANMAFLLALSAVLLYTTPPVQVTEALESFLKPLKLLRVPVEEIAMILGISFRFLPDLLTETEKIRRAQLARGARFSGRGVWGKATGVLPLVVPVFLSAFRRADALSTAMEARAYRGAAGRTHRTLSQLRAMDGAALGFCLSVLAVQIFAGYFIK